ncbi:MFS transporter [Alkalicoccus urumqiensis]|uniref:MFS transporter n=1 Tax=Alkalicoccus urumqiensis TaxID=1548213 RepID=A0A2P6MLI1_ALKUR|nr:MFS transporter [Alkalicoccus urumqiensis]PRO67137.1 MFS transporter [Alkalicoccus urumqiensis]
MAVNERDLHVQKENLVQKQVQGIGFGEKAGYGAGDLASNLIFSAISMFLLFYYTDVVGVSAAIIGTIILVSRLLDGLTDIGMGIVVDKTKSRFGKARPWLLWMALPYALLSVALFTVPPMGQAATLIYIVLTYNLIHIVYTAINIPYGVLNSLMTQDQYERSQLNIFRMFMALGGASIVMFGTLPLVGMFGGGQTGWTITFAIFGAIAGLLFLLTFFKTKERVAAADGGEPGEKTVPLKTGLKALFRNKYWGLLVAFSIVTYTGMGLSSGVNVYYAEYILFRPDLVGILGLAGIFPVMVGLLFMAPVIKRFGKRNAMLIGLAVSLLGTVLLVIDPASTTLVLAGAFIRGIGMAPILGSFFAMLADTIEYGEWKTGVRTEGLVYSAGSFGTKVGMGLGAAALGWGLTLGGYAGGATEQSASAVTAIIVLFIWLPAVIAVLQMIILFFYRLDQLYPTILSDLKKRKTADS